MYTYSCSFGTTQLALMQAQMALLIHSGWEFIVLDDRGGSNAWLIALRTAADRVVLPTVAGVVWYENAELAVKVSW